MAHYLGVRHASVYALVDATDTIRYVGKSIEPDKRYLAHLNEARTSVRPTHKINWIRAEVLAGRVPQLKILASGEWTSTELDEQERVFIAQHTESLTNARPGGEGGWGHITWTPAQREAASIRAKEWWATLSPKQRQGWHDRAVILGKSGLGSTRSDERKESMSQALKERWQDPEYRAHMSAVLSKTSSGERNGCYGKVYSEEERKKMSDAVAATRRTPESRKKSSDALKARWQTEEYRQEQRETYKRIWTPEKLKARGEAIRLGKERARLARLEAEEKTE